MNHEDLIIPDVVEEHAEEAAILWLHRDGALRSPDYDLTDLEELEERLDAHLDGLRVAGDAGWETLLEIGWMDAGEVFATALIALEAGDPDRVAVALDEATGGDPDLARGAISALGWLPFADAKRYWDQLTAAETPIRRRIGIGAAAIHRRDPGWALKECLEDDSPIVLARALRAVGELGRTDQLAACRKHLEHEDPECRFYAAWSAALLGDRSAAPRIRDFVAEGGALAARAADFAARALPPVDARAWLRMLKADLSRLRTALTVAAALGDPVEIPWILSLLTHEDLAAAAGEAFASITGVNLDEADLVLAAEPPEEVEEETTELDVEVETAEVVAPGDEGEDLPLPDPDAVRAWWEMNGERFAAGQRYVGGVLAAPGELSTRLLADPSGPMKYRAPAALEMALASPGKPLANVRARAREQRAALLPG